MKKIFFAAVIALAFTACNNSADSTADKKDSIDSTTNVKNENIDSSAEHKKDVNDSIGDKKKDSLDKADSANKAKK